MLTIVEKYMKPLRTVRLIKSLKVRLRIETHFPAPCFLPCCPHFDEQGNITFIGQGLCFVKCC